FEPARGDPNGFQVHRLNLSATTTSACGAHVLLAGCRRHRTQESFSHQSS
ncbi:hypothetical protein ABG768_027935, partial [Culter alburnus]